MEKNKLQDAILVKDNIRSKTADMEMLRIVENKLKILEVKTRVKLIIVKNVIY